MTLQNLVILFLILTVVSALSNYLFLIWTRTLGMKNLTPTESERWSHSYKPAIGGISFYIIFLVSYLVCLFYNNPELSSIDESVHQGVLIVVTLGFFAGLADDAFNTIPWLKLGAQIMCGMVLLLFGIQIEFFELVWADALLTVFWTVAVMNSINMLDNMDGITATVSVFILTAACTAPLAPENLFYTCICGGAVAALVGFLIFNWHPSRIFMGDTGSQMLGALLASIGVLFFWNNENIIIEHTWWSKMVIVATAFIVPIADSMTVTINRIKRGQSPFVGGKDHTTHHLSYAGLSDSKVAIVIALISAISSAFIVFISLLQPEQRSSYFIFLGIYSFLILVLLYGTTVWPKAKSVFHLKSTPTT